MRQAQSIKKEIKPDDGDCLGDGLFLKKKILLLQIINTDAPPSDDFTREYLRILSADNESSRSPWKVLGIPDTASSGDAKKVYGRLLNLFHPDRNPQLKGTMWERLTTSGIIRVKGAYEQIREEVRSEEGDTLETKLVKLENAYTDFLKIVFERTDKGEQYSSIDYPAFFTILEAYKGNPDYKPILPLPPIRVIIHKINDSCNYLTSVYKSTVFGDYDPQPGRFFSADRFCSSYDIPSVYKVRDKQRAKAEEEARRDLEESRIKRYGSFLGRIINRIR